MLKTFAVAVILIVPACAQNRILSVTNCIRPTAQDCPAAFDRTPYPKVYVQYLFETARVVFEQQAKLKLRLRHPEFSYRLDLGNLSIPWDKARYGRKAYITKRMGEGFGIEATVEGEEQWVALPGWMNKDDLSAKLLVLGFLTIWNQGLVEPFPLVCVDNYVRRALCKDDQTIMGMVKSSVIQAKFHMGKRLEAKCCDYSEMPPAYFINSRQRWVNFC